MKNMLNFFVANKSKYEKAMNVIYLYCSQTQGQYPQPSFEGSEM